MNRNAAAREPESHEVILLGKKYKLRSPHDDEYLAKLAHFVTGQVAEVQRRGAVSTLDAALLAALNIADEFFRHRHAAELRLSEVGEKTQSLLAALDEMAAAKAAASAAPRSAGEDAGAAVTLADAEDGLDALPGAVRKADASG